MVLYIFLTLIVTSFLVYSFHPGFGSKNSKEKLAEFESLSNFENGKFKNLVEVNMSMSQGDKNFFSMLKDFYFGDRRLRSPQETLQSRPINNSLYENNLDDEFVVTWLGHSILLIKVGDKTIITDPVFSKRSSPFEFFGPKRFSYENNYDVSDLPRIDAVLISHDHYDHLDFRTIKDLKDRVEKFYVPLGVGAHLLGWGVETDKIEEFNWYEKGSLDDVGLVFTPARHFSGRNLTDRMKTLWGGWIIQRGDKKIYFGGDSSYFDEFKKIGAEFGPFDIAFVECGAYDKSWKDVHMLPEETVQTAIDLNAGVLMPTHNSKFDLALHPWREPLDRVLEEANKRNATLATPMAGEGFILNQNIPQERWWEELR